MALTVGFSKRPEAPDLRIDECFRMFAIFDHAMMRESVEPISLPNVPSPEMSILRWIVAESGTVQSWFELSWIDQGCQH